MKSYVLIFFACLTPGHVLNAKLIRNLTDVASPYNSNVTFACPFDSVVALGDRLWVTPRSIYLDEDTVEYLWPKYSMNYDDVTNTYSLTVMNVTYLDGGTYECQAISSRIRSTAQLFVYALPESLIVSGHGGDNTAATAFENEVLSLTCTARGAYPAAVIKWFIDGVAVALNNITTEASSAAQHPSDLWDTVSYLVLMPTRWYQAKHISCQALLPSVAWARNESIVLQVQYAPTVVGVMLPSSTIHEGSTVAVKCTADSSPTTVQWQWYLNSSRILYANQSAITISDISYTYNGQVITCWATNALGTATWSTVLNIQFTPRLHVDPNVVEAELGGMASFSCTADGNPVPSIMWQKSGSKSQVLSNSSSLIIANITGADVGTYICVASTPAYTVTRSVSIQLKQADIPWMYAVIGVGSGVALVLLIVTLVCCLKMRRGKKKSEGSSSTVSTTTDISHQHVLTPNADDRSSGELSWQPQLLYKGIEPPFGRALYSPDQARLDSNPSEVEFGFQDALSYPTFTNNYLQFPECYKAVNLMHAVPPPPPFTFYPTPPPSLCSTSSPDDYFPTTARQGTPDGRSQYVAAYTAEPMGTMHSIHRYAVSMVTECQLATNV